jgi:hypothetical protein
LKQKEVVEGVLERLVLRTLVWRIVIDVVCSKSGVEEAII